MIREEREDDDHFYFLLNLFFLLFFLFPSFLCLFYHVLEIFLNNLVSLSFFYYRSTLFTDANAGSPVSGLISVRIAGIWLNSVEIIHLSIRGIPPQFLFLVLLSWIVPLLYYPNSYSLEGRGTLTSTVKGWYLNEERDGEGDRSNLKLFHHLFSSSWISSIDSLHITLSKIKNQRSKWDNHL